jgi:hypothetical protein
MNPVTAPVWLSGLVRLWRDPERRPYRAVAIAFVVLALTIAVVIGDRPYFLAPVYTALFAAGAVAFERRLTEGRARWSRRAAVAALLIGGLTALPVALPVLPASVLRTVPLQALNYDLGEQLSWPELSRTVVAAYRSLGRPDAVVVGSNYGEAGAVLRYAPPGIAGRAFSGQNTDWWYGPPPDDARAAVLIGFGREHVGRFWTDCRQFGRVRNAAGVDNDEDGQPVWICTGQRSSWSRSWPEFRHYGCAPPRPSGHACAPPLGQAGGRPSRSTAMSRATTATKAVPPAMSRSALGRVSQRAAPAGAHMLR